MPFNRAVAIFIVNEFRGANASSDGKMAQSIAEQMGQKTPDIHLRHATGSDCVPFVGAHSLIAIVVNARSFDAPSNERHLGPLDLSTQQEAFKLALRRAGENPDVVVLLLVQTRAQGENEIVETAKATDLKNVHIVNLPGKTGEAIRLSIETIEQHIVRHS